MTKIALTDKQKSELISTVTERVASKSTVTNTAKTLTRGEKGLVTGSQVTITAEGAGVGSPFRRNYLKKALAKLNVPGATVEVQKTARKSGKTDIIITFQAVEAPALEGFQPVEAEVTTPAQPEVVEA